MTCHYSDIEPQESLYTRAMEYGIAALAHDLSRRVGKPYSPAVLRSKLRPEAKTHVLSVDEFSAIVELLEGRGDPLAKMPLRALCWRHNMLAIDMPVSSEPVQIADIMGQVGRMATEFGDVVAEVTGATADRRITVNERERIEAEAEQLVQQVMRLRQTIAALAEQQEGEAE